MEGIGLQQHVSAALQAFEEGRHVGAEQAQHGSMPGPVGYHNRTHAVEVAMLSC